MLRESVRSGNRSPRMGSPKGQTYEQNKNRISALRFSLYSPKKNKNGSSKQETFIPSLTTLQTPRAGSSPYSIRSKENQPRRSPSAKLDSIHQAYREQLKQISEISQQKYDSCLDLADQLQKMHADKLLKMRAEIKDILSMTEFIRKQQLVLPSLRKKLVQENQQLKINNEIIANKIKLSRQAQIQKQEHLVKLKSQLSDCTDILQYFERLQLKEKKKIKQLQAVVDSHRKSGL